VDVLARIERAVIARRHVFTDKADVERQRDGLTETDVIESPARFSRTRPRTIASITTSAKPTRTCIRPVFTLLHSPLHSPVRIHIPPPIPLVRLLALLAASRRRLSMLSWSKTIPASSEFQTARTG